MGRVVKDVAVDAGADAVILGTKHCDPFGDNKRSSSERESTSDWPRISISAKYTAVYQRTSLRLCPARRRLEARV